MRVGGAWTTWSKFVLHAARVFPLLTLAKLESITKKKRGGRQSLTPQLPNEQWLERAADIFSSLDAGSAQYLTPSASRIVVPSSMTLRERKKPGYSAESSPVPSPSGKGSSKNKRPEKAQKIPTTAVEVVNSDSASSNSNSADGNSSAETALAPKVRRVILHVRDPVNDPFGP
jgi:histone deacetylase HOS3